MIRLPVKSLSASADIQLRNYQQNIDQIGNYHERVVAAKTSFSRYNKKNNPTFIEVRARLAQMCCGARRCCYCEDSVADEVEHVYPKDLYPDRVFVWENYVYACGPCNSPKNSRFAVIELANGQLIEVSRPNNAPVEPPQPGQPALIDPRNEDPLNFLELDIPSTFYFVPRSGLSAVDKSRADYTREILHLNDRDYLVEARRTAYYSYQALLGIYIDRLNNNASIDDLIRLIDVIKHMNHPTVWREMQRQHDLINELQPLFHQAPEALMW